MQRILLVLVWAAKRYVTYSSRIRGSHLQSVDYAGCVKMARNGPDVVTESWKSLFHYLWRPTLGAVILFIPISAWSQNGRDNSFIQWVHNEPREKDLPVPDYYLHKIFASKVAGQEVGYCIYLPPGYGVDPHKRYPVIYNLHGNGGNEWNRGQECQILHEGILNGRWPAMIMVFPNGGKSTFYKDSYDGKLPIETMFITELIPHIDKTYNTIAQREGRCIEGFSMGGRGSTRLAMKYPELFCSLFCQAGNVPHTSENFDPGSPNEYPNYYLGLDKQAYIDNDAFRLLEKNVDQIKKMRILIACGTLDDGHIVTIREFHQALLDHGVDHTYWELEGLKHERKRFMELLSPILYDYHVESLRLAGGFNEL